MSGGVACCAAPSDVSDLGDLLRGTLDEAGQRIVPRRSQREFRQGRAQRGQQVGGFLRAWRFSEHYTNAASQSGTIQRRVIGFAHTARPAVRAQYAWRVYHDEAVCPLFQRLIYLSVAARMGSQLAHQLRVQPYQRHGITGLGPQNARGRQQSVQRHARQSA